MCFCHLDVFSLTCCSDLLEKVGITSAECWVSPLLTGGVAVPDHLLDEAVSLTVCRHQLLRCYSCNCPSWGGGRGTTFVLYLSEPVLLSLINSGHYRETPRKKLFTEEKGREKHLETQLHREEYGLQLQMQASLLGCDLLWSQKFTEEQGQNWQSSVCPCVRWVAQPQDLDVEFI